MLQAHLPPPLPVDAAGQRGILGNEDQQPCFCDASGRGWSAEPPVKLLWAEVEGDHLARRAPGPLSRLLFTTGEERTIVLSARFRTLVGNEITVLVDGRVVAHWSADANLTVWERRARFEVGPGDHDLELRCLRYNRQPGGNWVEEHDTRPLAVNMYSLRLEPD